MTDEKFVMNDAISREVPRVGPPGYDELWDRKQGRYFDRRGNELSMREWTMLFQDRDYQIVRQDHVGDYFVSTVWLGLDHSFTTDSRQIFETMVFNQSKPKPPDFPDIDPREIDFRKPLPEEFQEWLDNYPEQTSASDIECERYGSEEEALAGHQRLVERVRLLVDFTTPD